MRPIRLYRMIPLAAIVLGTFSSSSAAAAETKAARLTAPAKWTGETIRLPPGFARDMTFNGTEHVRFAPGMFKPESDSFFSYVFVFELKKGTKVDAQSLNRELLKYYRGLSKTVLGDQAATVDFSTFKLKLTKAKQPAKKPDEPLLLRGKLDWVEPFATKSRQTLHLELHTWTVDDHELVFVCVSPQPATTPSKTTPGIWQQMRKIRSDYRAASTAVKAATP